MSDCSMPENPLDSAVYASPPAPTQPPPKRRWLVGLGAAGVILAVGVPLV